MRNKQENKNTKRKYAILIKLALYIRAFVGKTELKGLLLEKIEPKLTCDCIIIRDIYFFSDSMVIVFKN